MKSIEFIWITASEETGYQKERDNQRGVTHGRVCSCRTSSNKADSEMRFRLVKMKGVRGMHSIESIFTKEKTNKVQTITSLEVAEVVEKRHTDLLRDIRRYCEQLNESNIALVDFFTESTYADGKGEKRTCYDVTRKGCELIDHKLTGVKDAVFTANFINRFHDMEVAA